MWSLAGKEAWTLVSNIELIAYIGSFHSALIAWLLLGMPQGNSLANRLLAALLVLSGCYLLASGIANRPEFHGYALNRLASWLVLCFGPLLWFYVKSVSESKFHIQPKLFLHFAPALFCLIYLTYHADSPGISEGSVNPIGIVVSILVAISLCGYSIMSWWALKMHQKEFEEVISSPEWTNYAWIRLLIYAIFAFILFGIAGEALWQLEIAPLMGAGLRAAVFNYLMCYLILIEAFLHPEIFSLQYRELLELKDVRAFDEEVNSNSEDSKADKQKYQRSGLTEEATNQLWTTTRETLEARELYLESDLRISDLAEAMDTSINHLSQSINMAGKESFYDLINTYRIKHACELLRDPAWSRKSVLDIALDSGFNSQSAFYKAFKRVEGITPARYRKSH